MNITIDASVFVSAARSSEEQFAVSFEFIQRAKGKNVFCPTLVLPECSAAIARPTGDSVLSKRLVSLIERLPGMTLVPLGRSLAIRASDIATGYRLRGADAVYVAVAEAFDAVLISWDAEMLQRSPESILAITPLQWLDGQI